MTNRKVLMTREEVKRFWEEKKEKAMRKLETARGKETVKKLNREVQVCDMTLRQMEKGEK